MKIFISMPMHGRSDECIKDCRDEIITEIKEMFGIKDTIDVIDNFHKTIPDGLQNERVWCLGDSIRLMQDADLVVFAWNWRASRGCPVEMEVCNQYDIPYIVLSSPAEKDTNPSYHYTHGVGCKREPVLNDGILGRVDVQ